MCATVLAAISVSGRPDNPPASPASGCDSTPGRPMVVLVAMIPATPTSVQTCSSSSIAGRGQVRRDLHQDRLPAQATDAQRGRLGVQGGQQFTQVPGVLQRPQSRRVRRRHVDREVVAVRGRAAAARSRSPRPRPRAESPSTSRSRSPAGSPASPYAASRSASAAEPRLLKPIRLITASCSTSRNNRGFVVPRLRMGGDGADLDEAEAERAPGRQGDPVLVHPRGQTDRGREADAEDRPAASRSAARRTSGTGPRPRRGSGRGGGGRAASARARPPRRRDPAGTGPAGRPAYTPRILGTQSCSDRTPMSPACCASIPWTAAASPCTVVMHGMLRATAALRIS